MFESFFVVSRHSQHALVMSGSGPCARARFQPLSKAPLPFQAPWVEAQGFRVEALGFRETLKP